MDTGIFNFHIKHNLPISPLVLFWSIGIILCFAYYILIRKKFKISFLMSILLCFIILLAEILGAKILFLFERIPNVTIDDLTALGGFSLFGVFLISPLFMFLFSLLLKIKFIKLMDYMSLGIFLELACYRISCIYNGCCGGITFPWGFLELDGSHTFPVQPIEIGLDVLAFAILLILFLTKKLKYGDLFYLTYLSYGLIRFVLEFFRVRDNLFLNMSISHIFAFICIVFGLIMFILNRCNKLKYKSDEKINS